VATCYFKENGMPKGTVNQDLAGLVSGRSAPASFPVMDSSSMELSDTHKILREDVKMNRIRYEFPSGFNKLDLFEECRALTLLDDFQTMYDITMQMLVDKDLVIKIKNNDGGYSMLCEAHITDKFQNLRGFDAIDSYPVLITWLTEFIAEELLKKYPLPGNDQPQPQTAETQKKGTKAGKGTSKKYPS
jgi:hypothetical protein